MFRGLTKARCPFASFLLLSRTPANICGQVYEGSLHLRRTFLETVSDTKRMKPIVAPAWLKRHTHQPGAETKEGRLRLLNIIEDHKLVLGDVR